MNEVVEITDKKFLTPVIRFKEFDGSWKKGTIGDYYKNLRTGMTPSRLKPNYFKGNIPWITSGELNYGVIENTIESITEDAAKNTNLKLYPANTLFIAITGLEAPGTRGKCAINGVPATTNQSCMAFEVTPEVDTLFLFQWYKKEGIRLYYAYAQGTKQQSFNNKLVKRFVFNIPTLPEQQKIASFLTTVDEKIQQLTRKKELLEQYKKGVMQQLFSGGLRFKPALSNVEGDENGKDFPEWEEKRLGEIADVSKLAGYEFTKHVIYEATGKIIALRGLNIKKNSLDLTDVKYIDNSELTKLTRSKLYVDDMMFTYIGTIGEVALIKENDRFYLAPNVSRIRFNKQVAIPLFIMQYFCNSSFKNREIKQYVSSSSQPALTMENVRKFRIYLPSFPEQQKIANYLTSIDTKISLVTEALEGTNKFKKGLLQQMFV